MIRRFMGRYGVDETGQLHSVYTGMRDVPSSEFPPELIPPHIAERLAREEQQKKEEP